MLPVDAIRSISLNVFLNLAQLMNFFSSIQFFFGAFVFIGWIVPTLLVFETVRLALYPQGKKRYRGFYFVLKIVSLRISAIFNRDVTNQTSLIEHKRYSHVADNTITSSIIELILAILAFYLFFSTDFHSHFEITVTTIVGSALNLLLFGIQWVVYNKERRIYNGKDLPGTLFSEVDFDEKLESQLSVSSLSNEIHTGQRRSIRDFDLVELMALDDDNATPQTQIIEKDRQRVFASVYASPFRAMIEVTDHDEDQKNQP